MSEFAQGSMRADPERSDPARRATFYASYYRLRAFGLAVHEAIPFAWVLAECVSGGFAIDQSERGRALYDKDSAAVLV
jgi:hypothetical protein